MGREMEVVTGVGGSAGAVRISRGGEGWRGGAGANGRLPGGGFAPVLTLRACQAALEQRDRTLAGTIRRQVMPSLLPVIGNPVGRVSRLSRFWYQL